MGLGRVEVERVRRGVACRRGRYVVDDQEPGPLAGRPDRPGRGLDEPLRAVDRPRHAAVVDRLHVGRADPGIEEAVFDEGRIVAITSGDSIKVIGYSSSARHLLKVWLYPKDLMAGDWWGASACEANTTDKRNYKEANK